MAAERTSAKRRRWLGAGELGQGIFLLLLWLLLSGRFDAFHVGSGVLAVFLVVWLDRKLGPANLETEDQRLRPHLGRILLYLPWLAWQMLLSSWQVARAILAPDMRRKISPNLVTFRSGQPHTVARVILGNSITLTPGTLTLDIEGDDYLVHSLTDQTARSLLDGTMQRKVAAMFSTELEEPVSNPRILTGRRRD